MNNDAYLDSVGVTLPEVRERCLRAMAKYGENHWWLDDADTANLAYHQLHEDILLVKDFSRFHAAVEALLVHPVMTHSFALSIEQLRAEARVAWRRYLEKQKAIPCL